MTLSSPQLDRYARHLLLVEIGVDGQEQLLNARFDTDSFEPSVASVAHNYLVRAGLRPSAVDEDERGASMTLSPMTTSLRHGGDPEGEAASASRGNGPGDEDTSASSGRVGESGDEPANAAVRAVLGAWAAVETIKQTLDLGTPATFPVELIESATPGSEP